MDVIQNMSREELRTVVVRLDDRCRALAQERDAAQFEAAHYHKLTDNLGRAGAVLEAERDAARAEVERLREALEMIAGRRQCIDNLLGNQAIARIALDQPRAALGAKEEQQ